MNDSLYLSVGGGSRFEVVRAIPPGDYRPCISVSNAGQRLQVAVSTPAAKRLGEHDSQQLLKMSKSMWEDRVFADATVVCGGRCISVHRCILSAASPFFAKAFQGQMREAKDASIMIKDASADAVEHFLQYLY